MLSSAAVATIAAACTPLALLGPPRLIVAAGAPGQPLTVTVEHFDGVGHIVLTARVLRLTGGTTTEIPATVAEAGAPSPNRRSFIITPPRRSGVPSVVVIRGEHGEDGPAMEAMVSIDGVGAVVGIEYSKKKSVLGGWRFPDVSDDDIETALRALTRGGR